MELNLFDKDTLNIFCDASIFKHTNETVGCPGSIAIRNTPDPVIYQQDIRIVRCSSNNNSEITAILMAIQQAILLRSEDITTINIFSDSKISVYGLRNWIFSWANDLREQVMYSSSGTPVANQQIFLHIINLLVTAQLNVNIYHQKGHVSGNGLEIAKRVFLESNGISISDEEARYISCFNDHVDKVTKQELKQLGNRYTHAGIVRNPIIYHITPELLESYKTLINQD